MDHDADYAAYVRESWSTLVRSAVFLGCSLHEAEDLAQTTLVRCYTAWPTVAAADNRAAYVYRMLLNCLRDSKRRRWWGERPSERLPESRTSATRDVTADVDTADAVHRALAGLTKINRDVVVLRYFTGLSEQQTAEVLDIPTGTVKSRLSRSLAQLAADDHLAELRPEHAPDPSDSTEGATS
ncbi:SigE family RNA polymerase sigma factor [Nocardioides sp.]|uniref:SigE family RNA polymerase sigma factor n=1 Tax=Nocardioides sp. TaxID=35761 RepID=UPI002720187B|nr:SigE family RNA polymerase sigma factor [Nocardioides sp.]MDO9455351.1 SigE family RNA polymerase sigma factor [Nocardioides sp.]